MEMVYLATISVVAIMLWALQKVATNQAKNFWDGLLQVRREFSDALGFTTPTPPPQKITADYFTEFTELLQKSMTYPEYERGREDKQQLEVYYRFKTLNTDAEALECLFAFFIRGYFNFDIERPVEVFAHRRGDHLMFIFAKTDKKVNWIKKQKRIRSKRLQQNDIDLLE